MEPVENAVLREASSANVKADRDKREAIIDVIEVGMGNTRDRRVYEAPYLEASAAVLKDAQMYANHLLPDDAKKLKGMPRDIRDLAGRMVETWWNPEGGRSGRGSIQARVTIPAGWLWEIVEHDPELLGVSINAMGRTRPTTGPDGEPAHLVEAITAVHSVDWVAKAGAGGRVVELAEAFASDNQTQESSVAIEWKSATLEDLRRERPDLAQAVEEEFAEEIDRQIDAVMDSVDEGDDDLDTSEITDEDDDDDDVTTTASADDDDDTDESDEQEADSEADSEGEESHEKEEVAAGVTEGFISLTEHAVAIEEAEKRMGKRFERKLLIRENRATTRELLMESGLAQLSQEDIAEDFHDFAGSEKDLKESVKAAIRAKKAEIAQNTGRGRVRGMGMTKGVDTGAEKTSTKRVVESAHGSMMTDMGLSSDERLVD